MPLTVNTASFFSPTQETTRLVWSKNIVFLDLQAPVGWDTFDTYFVELEIGVESVGTIVTTPFVLNIAEEEPNEFGNIIFEIENFIDDCEYIKIPVPDFNSTLVEIHNVPKFYVKIYENIDGIRTQMDFARMTGASGSPARRWLFEAIQAGLDRESFNYELQQEWIFDTEKRKFLTSVEDRKSSHKMAQEFLYWYGSLPNRDGLSVYSKIYYTDNTEETVIVFDSTLLGSEIQCIPTRYDLIKQKSTQPTKKIEAWSIYIGYNVSGSVFRASEFFRYELPDQPNREAKNFLYRNSLGVFDTLVCAGDFEEYLESESSYASIKDKPNYEVSEAQKLLISQTGKRGGTANTVFLNRDQADSKQDFILSKEILVQDKNQFIPVTVAKNKQIYNIKNSSLLGYSFEYEHAHNVRLYTKDWFRPKLAEVPSPPSLPKFIIKNTGPSGYVRVEYDSIIVDVAPNTEKAIEIGLGVSVKVTWGIVNLTTGLLDASLINISYPNYSFPSRLDTAIFDSVLQAGVVVVGIADDGAIKRARQFIFLMPNNDYLAEVKFKELSVVDIDFENPACYVLSGSDIVTVKDRRNLVNANQTTPTRRHQLVSNALRCSPKVGTANGGYAFSYVGNLHNIHTSYFVTMQVHNIPTTKLAEYFGVGYTGVAEANPPTGSKILTGFGMYYNMSIGASSNEDTFGWYNDKRALYFYAIPSSGLPTPSFSMSANLNKKLTLSLKKTDTIPKLQANGIEHTYQNIVKNNLNVFGSVNGSAYNSIFPNNLQGQASVHRILTTENLTDSEYVVLNQKFREKYN